MNLWIILSTVHVNAWNMLISTNWYWKFCLKKLTNYEQNKTNLPYTINVTTHRPASTTDIHHMYRTLQNAFNCGTWCWTVWHALELILLCYHQSAFSLKDITQDQFEVTVSAVSSGHVHCDNIWSGVWIPMGLHPFFIWKLGAI